MMMTYEFSEQEVFVQGEFELSATLTIPKGTEEKYPAIVLVSGTGGANRDGNMKKFNINIYKQLAEFLSGLGFITIRYDKRGIAKSKGDHLKTGMNDLVDDIISNVKFLQGLQNVDPEKIILLGHSEGCILSTIANQKYPVGGLMLIAGAGVSIKTAMQAQNLSLVEEIKKMAGVKGLLLRKILTEEKVVTKQNKLFDKVKDTEEDVIKIQLKKFPAKWLREHLTYKDEDVIDMLKNTKCPVFVATGDKDVQADADDLKRIESLDKENISCFVVKDMDHILKEFKGQKTILNIMKQYKKEIDNPLHPELKELMKGWLL